MRLFKPFVGLLGMVFVLSGSASAKDLSGRLGIGFTNEFSNSTVTREVPALSAKYGASKDLHVQGALGFHTAIRPAVTLAGKVYKNIFYETNLNFYAAVGLAYLKADQSGVEF